MMRAGLAIMASVVAMTWANATLAQPRPSKLPADDIVSQEAKDAADLTRTCAGGRWNWQKSTWPPAAPVEFATPMQPLRLEIDLQGGKVKGVNQGEFGGELWAKHADGRDILISNDTVQGLLRTSRGAIVLFGLRHRSNRGHAMFLHEGEQHWPLSFIGALPRKPEAITELDENAFAVRLAPGEDGKVRVMIISDHHVIGEAYCVREQQRARRR